MSPPAPSSPPPSLLDGPRSFLVGMRFVLLQPRNWPLAIVPVLIAFLLVGVLSALGLWGAFAVAQHLTGSLHGRLGSAAGFVVKALLALVTLVLAVVLGFSLAQPLSSPALEKLARAFEGELGAPARPDEDLLESVGRGLRVTFSALLLGTPVLLVLSLVNVVLPLAVVVTVPLKVVVTSLMVAWDLLDYPFSLRQMRVRERIAWIRGHFRSVLTFGMLGALGLMVPLVGLFVLPIGVASATHFVLAREGALAAVAAARTPGARPERTE